MLLPCPLCPLIAAKIAGLQAIVLLLLTLLIKARIQIKAASALGLFCCWPCKRSCFWPAPAPWAWRLSPLGPLL